MGPHRLDWVECRAVARLGKRSEVPLDVFCVEPVCWVLVIDEKRLTLGLRMEVRHDIAEKELELFLVC